MDSGTFTSERMTNQFLRAWSDLAPYSCAPQHIGRGSFAVRGREGEGKGEEDIWGKDNCPAAWDEERGWGERGK